MKRNNDMGYSDIFVVYMSGNKGYIFTILNNIYRNLYMFAFFYFLQKPLY